jgi:hypothetical protein
VIFDRAAGSEQVEQSQDVAGEWAVKVLGNSEPMASLACDQQLVAGSFAALSW